MNHKTLNILLIGGLGFIGQSLINFLDEENKKRSRCIKIFVLTRSLADKQSFPTKVDSYYTGSATDSLLIQRILFEKKIHYIIHLAGSSTVDDANLNPSGTYIDNVKMTTAICEACAEYRRIHGILLASTSLIYHGSRNKNPHSENEQIDARFLSPYIKSKYLAEFRAFDIQNLPIVIMRLSNIYGPGDFHKRLIPLTIRRLLNGEPPQIYIDTNTKLSAAADYLFISDLTKAIFKIILKLEKNIDHNSHKTSFCSIVNIGSGHMYRTEDIVWALINEIDPRQKPTIIEKQGINPHGLEMNVKKIEKEYKFSSKTDLAAGIKITVNEWKKYWRE